MMMTAVITKLTTTDEGTPRSPAEWCNRIDGGGPLFTTEPNNNNNNDNKNLKTQAQSFKTSEFNPLTPVSVEVSPLSVNQSINQSIEGSMDFTL